MENYKSLLAYRYFVDGWVQPIVHFKIGNVIIMKAEVTPSYQVNNETHNPWIALKDTGSVITGHCTCLAG